MWSCKPYQRELNWTEPFSTFLGSYIFVPARTLLWSKPGLQKSPLYQFSAKSYTYSESYCADRNLSLIDFRYAVILLSDIQITWKDTVMNLTKPYTVDSIVAICMHIKEISNSGIVDGILIPTKYGNHIVLFDLKDVESCALEPIIPIYCPFGIPGSNQDLFQERSLDALDIYQDLKMWEFRTDTNVPRTHMPISSLIQNEFPARLYVVNGISNNPIDCRIPEGSIEEFGNAIHIQKKEWHSTARLELAGLRQPNVQLLYPGTIDMSKVVYKDIEWNKSFFPVYGSFITIPEHTVLWRGYDRKYPSLGTRPVYFGDKKVAKSYAGTSGTHALGLFATTKPLKLIDIRFLKVLLTDLLYERTGNLVLKTTVAFGLCSYYHQLRLMMTLYKDSIANGKDEGFNAMKSMLNTSTPTEQPGVRVAETSNDGWVMAFLGEVFDGLADGFIAPELFSPYQVHTNNRLHPEMIVFSPAKSGIVQLTSEPKMTTISIQSLIQQQFPSPIKLHVYEMETTYVPSRGGSISTIPAIEAFNSELNRGNSIAIKIYHEAVKEGKKLRKQVTFSI